MAFSDEFSATPLDLSRWSPNDPILRRPSDPSTIAAGTIQVSSLGLITTYGLFSQAYGRFEVRCRIPGGRPRISLLPVPSGSLPAIDIYPFANHWGTEQTERFYGTESDLSPGFHTIVLEWDHDSLRWFVDGKEKFQSADGVPHQPMYLILRGPLDVDYIHVYRQR